MIKHIAYQSGQIRNMEGKLIAFYDADIKTLYIDGKQESFHAKDIDTAMEIVGILCN
ncbi:MAG: hypothetical protein KGI50_07605 [Patescibacteria group bacterium]|nr:hypothetical protein [Patescibacteria group bacterium]